MFSFAGDIVLDPFVGVGSTLKACALEGRKGIGFELNPKYAPSWREWAISLYAQERYSEAWIRVRQARALDADPFPPEFLKKLSEKMSEPK